MPDGRREWSYGLNERTERAQQRAHLFRGHPPQRTGEQFFAEGVASGRPDLPYQRYDAMPLSGGARVRIPADALISRLSWELDAMKSTTRWLAACSTARTAAAKHGIGFLNALVMLTQGEPWMPAAA
jgi:hypothetical protein